MLHCYMLQCIKSDRGQSNFLSVAVNILQLAYNMTIETPARIEPCGIEEEVPVALTDLVLNIRSAAEALG